MSAPDRNWTIAPTFVWFAVLATVTLRLVDGDFDAIADRLTRPRDAETPAAGIAGPSFQTPQTANASEEEPAPVLRHEAAGSHDVGALDDVCVDGASDAACKRWAMDGFYKAMKAAKAGKLGRALRVSWYGDSVVASDSLPGRLRSRLQADVGDGGPGFVYALPPHRFCGHESITRSGGDNWLVYAISTVHTGDGFYGPGGSTAETNSGSVTIKVGTSPVTSAELYYLQQPAGGNAILKADGSEVLRTSTGGKAKAAGWVSAAIPAGARKFELEARGGKTRVFGLALENATGATVDNFGIVNVNAKTFTTHSPSAFTEQLTHRASDLVIIMIGANEAQWLKVGDKAMKQYQAEYEKVLAPVRQARPDASCLVMSPTDEAEPDGTKYKSRAIIPAVVEAQRKAAHAQGCAFYSSYDWMGGTGSAVKWFKKHLISSDMIHLTAGGATKMSDGLYDALTAGLKGYAGD